MTRGMIESFSCRAIRRKTGAGLMAMLATAALIVARTPERSFADLNAPDEVRAAETAGIPSGESDEQRISPGAPWVTAVGSALAAAAPVRLESEAFIPIKKRGLLVGCAGAAASEQNPVGLRDWQWRSTEDAQIFYRRHYSRAERLGIDRVVWHMPAGFQESGMRGRFAVLTVMGERGPVFVAETQRFILRNPDASVGVYISAYMPQTLFSYQEDDILPFEPYDASLRHREMISATIRPLVLAGVREIWLDNSAHGPNRGAMLDLADHLRSKYGVYVCFEGIPNRRIRGTTQRELDMSVLSDYAGMGIHRLIQARDTRDEWQISDQIEVIAVLSAHDIDRNGGETIPTRREVLSYINRGFTLFSMSEDFDEFLLD